MSGGAFADKYGPWGLVAGASEGLGAAIAGEIAARGVNVILVARRREPLEELAASLRARHGVQVRVATIDLAEPDLAQRARDAAAGLDVGLLVYNAAYSEIGGFLEQPLESKLKTLDVNCRAPLVLVDAFARPMAARGRGGVLLMSSLAGCQGAPLVSVYAATKAFNTVLGESLWEELRRHGVDALSFLAGATTTPNFLRTKPRRAGVLGPPVMRPEAVAREALEALGRGPRAVAGRANRVALFVMERLLARRQRIEIMGRATRRMYAANGASGA